VREKVGRLREPATERQRLLQAVVKIQRYWINRALAPVLHFDPHMCRKGLFRGHKPKSHLMQMHFGDSCGPHSPYEDYGFNKLGLRMLVSRCIEEYYHDAWRVARAG
jgi:hypothetical protein